MLVAYKKQCKSLLIEIHIRNFTCFKQRAFWSLGNLWIKIRLNVHVKHDKIHSVLVLIWKCLEENSLIGKILISSYAVDSC